MVQGIRNHEGVAEGPSRAAGLIGDAGGEDQRGLFAVQIDESRSNSTMGAWFPELGRPRAVDFASSTGAAIRLRWVTSSLGPFR